MNIDRPNSYGAVSGPALRGVSSKPVSAIAESRVTQDDSAIRHSDAAKIAQKGAPVNLAKVEQIRADIAAGHYMIDVQMLAQKMIAMDLFGEN